MLIPVPLHWISLVRRGFNQSNTIAQQLGLLLDNSLVRTDILYRSRYSKPQHLQGKKDRLRSMADALSVDIWCIARTGWHIDAA